MLFSKHNKKLGLLSVCCAIAMGCACGCSIFDTVGRVKNPPYSWGICNKTTHTLNASTKVTYLLNGEKIRSVGGSLAPGGREVYDEGLSPIPEVVHVSWEYQDIATVDTVGYIFVPHEGDVAVSKIIKNPSQFEGEIWIVITNDGIHVDPIRSSEARQGVVPQ